MTKIGFILGMLFFMSHIAYGDRLAQPNSFRPVWQDIGSYELIPEQASWSIESLAGKMSFHDGANCFNGTLAAKGYVDHLVHSDASELRFFLSHFCRENLSGIIKKGDILTVERDGQLEHSAIFLGDHKIFDKNSIAGLHGAFRSDKDYRYGVRDISQSSYFENCRMDKNGNCKIVSYTCEESAAVRLKMHNCYKTADRMGLRTIQSYLENITLDSHKDFDVNNFPLHAFRDLIASIDRMSGDDGCALYILTSSSSVIGNIFNLNYELQGLTFGSSQSYPQIHVPYRELAESLINLEQRILKYGDDPKSKEIFSEPNWYRNP